MKCKNCGSENNEGSSFCSNCGYPFKNESITDEKVGCWYYYNGVETIGPLEESEIGTHQIKDNYLVWTSGMEDWVAYSNSELFKKSRSIEKKESSNILPIIIYASLVLIALLCFFPMYRIVETNSIVPYSSKYKMLEDIAIYIIPCMAIIATTVAAKKYFASFWITLILGIIMYVRLVFVPSVDIMTTYELLNYGIVFYLSILCYISLFVSVSILFAKAQKNSVKSRYIS